MPRLPDQPPEPVGPRGIGEGQLGLGDIEDRVLPTRIAAGGWAQVAAGRFYTCAKKLDETIKQFAEDFGYDLDEDGQPISDESADAPRRSEEREAQPA